MIDTCCRDNIRIIDYNSSEYPQQLSDIPNSPVVLFGIGNVELLQNTSVAVVGTRSPSADGIDYACKISHGLSQSGITVVSGLAKGIDSYAHKGALEGIGGTIAVLGCGLTHYYPRENERLRDQIEQHGLVISELAPNTSPNHIYFPKRNRIITGLSKGVLVIEGKSKSGTINAANAAIKQRRKVFAVEGIKDAERRHAPELLIRNGATPVRDAADIIARINLKVSVYNDIEENGVPAENYSKQGLTDEEIAVMDRLSAPANFEEILQSTAIATGKLLGLLSKLEITGMIKLINGTKYRRTSPGEKV